MNRRQILLCFLSLCFLPVGLGWWHLYSHGKKVPKECPGQDSYGDYSVKSLTFMNSEDVEVWRSSKIGPKSAIKPLSSEEIQKWKLWPGLMSEDDAKNGEIIFGFREAMEAIWKNQHPEDCSKAKFLIANGFSSGFGSEIHVVGVGLALAMNMNRVYILDPRGTKVNDFIDNRWQTDSQHCRDQGKTTLECYFEPWTSCSIKDALGDKDVSDLNEIGVNWVSDTDIHNKKLWDLPAKTILLESRADVHDPVPLVLSDLFKCSPFDTHFQFYWWRAVSTAFMLRPNELTLRLFQKHSTLNIDKEREQCVSIYVRRGDKHVETELIPFPVYAIGAAALWEEGLVPGPLAATSPGVLFLGSEDPGVIEEGSAWAKSKNWKAVHTELFDRRSVSAGFNFTVQQEQKKQKKHAHHELEYFSMLLNLDYHVKCRAFVCMMKSNFCRVIDELRSTVGGKANRHYMDVSAGCGDHPCLDHNFELGWR